MNSVERTEALVKKCLGFAPPFSEITDERGRALALRSFEYILEHLSEVVTFLDGGLEVIPDPKRRELILGHVGPQNGTDPEEYRFNLWLANECIGWDHDIRYVLLRCAECHRIRVNRFIRERVCKCGGRRLTNTMPPTLNTRMVMKALVMGR